MSIAGATIGLRGGTAIAQGSGMPSTPQTPLTTGRHHKLRVAVAILLVALAVLAFWAWREGAEERAIAKLPADERAEVYRRELASFRTLCGQGPRADELQDQCREKAKLIVLFPECDAT